MLPNWSAQHPFRAPNWRWLRASELANGDQTSFPRNSDNDRFVLRAVNFIRRQRECTSDDDLLRLYQSDPSGYSAWQIQADPAYNKLRCEIEARILAEESAGKIASRFGMSHTIIHFYIVWFYDVCDLLNCFGYVMQHLLLPLIPNRTVTERDYEFLWKYYAYAGGSGVLDSLIYGFHNREKTTNEDEVNDFWTKDFKRNITRKTAISAKIIPLMFEAQIPLITSKQNALERQQDENNNSTTVFLQNLQTCMSNFPWTFDTKADEGKKLMLGNASLRASEIISLSEKPEQVVNLENNL